MKIFRNLVTMGLASVMLISCSDNGTDPVNSGTEGGSKTYAALRVNTNPETRAITESDYAGTEQEFSISKLSLYLPEGVRNWNSDNLKKDKNVYTVAPWETTAGRKRMALIANRPASVTLAQSSEDMASYIVEKPNIKEYSTNYDSSKKTGGFVMTSKLETKEVMSNVAESEVTSTNGENKNYFKFDLERVASKAVVALGSMSDKKTEITLYKVPYGGMGDPEECKVAAIPVNSIVDGSLLGHIVISDDNIGPKYSVVNGAVPVYLFANNAGDRTMSEVGETGKSKYKEFKSAIHDYVEFQEDYTNADLKKNLVRLSNYSGLNKDSKITDDNIAEAIEELTKLGYEAKSVNAKAEDNNDGIYFFENSIREDKFNSKDGFYRMAYAKIYATFIPAEGKIYTCGKDNKRKAITGKDYEKHLKINNADKNVFDNLTFYRGENGLIYDSKASATNDGNNKVYEYKSGRCGYRSVLNRVTTKDEGKNTKTLYADTRRNNIYKIKITGFKKLGLNWDPSDPFDPYLPKPSDDAEDPTNTITPPDIDKAPTYMTVEATVEPWNVVEREEVLE